MSPPRYYIQYHGKKHLSPQSRNWISKSEIILASIESYIWTIANFFKLSFALYCLSPKSGHPFRYALIQSALANTSYILLILQLNFVLYEMHHQKSILQRLYVCVMFADFYTDTRMPDLEPYSSIGLTCCSNCTWSHHPRLLCIPKNSSTSQHQPKAEVNRHASTWIHWDKVSSTSPQVSISADKPSPTRVGEEQGLLSAPSKDSQPPNQHFILLFLNLLIGVQVSPIWTSHNLHSRVSYYNFYCRRRYISVQERHSYMICHGILSLRYSTPSHQPVTSWRTAQAS